MRPSPGSEDATTHPRVSLARAVLIGGWTIVGLWAVGLFLPVYAHYSLPSNPVNWPLVLNHAWSSGLEFGTDVVFTYGPLAFVSARSYAPESYPVLLILWIWLIAVLLYSLFKIITTEAGPAAAIGLSAAMIAVLGLELNRIGPDPLFFSFGVLLFLHTVMGGSRRQLSVVSILLFSGMLIGSLGKFSILVFETVVMVFLALHIGTVRRRVPVLPLAWLIAFPLAWAAAGQSLSNLPRYLLWSLEVTSGYAEAMSLTAPGGGQRILLVMAVQLLTVVVLVIASSAGETTRRRTAMIVSFLFLSTVSLILFRVGFVRHDLHEVTATTSFAFMALLAVALTRRGAGTGTAVAAWSGAAGMLFALSLGLQQFADTNLPRELRIAARVVTSPFRFPGMLGEWEHRKVEYRQAHDQLADEFPVPPGREPIDVYPWDVAAAVASGAAYSPRPVFISYSAYTPPLASLNEQHLRGARAPERILFDIQTIDGRLPSFDDGLSWPTILSHYELEQSEGRWLELVRSDPASRRAVDRRPTYSMQAEFGKDIAIPEGLVWAEVSIDYTLTGKLMKTMYKPPVVRLDVEGITGDRRSYRFLPSMARSGFLLSPLVETREHFASLMRGERPDPQEVPRSMRFTVSESAAGAMCFEKSIDVRFFELIVE